MKQNYLTNTQLQRIRIMPLTPSRLKVIGSDLLMAFRSSTCKLLCAAVDFRRGTSKAAFDICELKREFPSDSTNFLIIKIFQIVSIFQFCPSNSA